MGQSPELYAPNSLVPKGLAGSRFCSACTGYHCLVQLKPSCAYRPQRGPHSCRLLSYAVLACSALLALCCIPLLIILEELWLRRTGSSLAPCAPMSTAYMALRLSQLLCIACASGREATWPCSSTKYLFQLRLATLSGWQQSREYFFQVRKCPMKSESENSWEG